MNNPIVIDLRQGMDPMAIVNELTYQNYAHNRKISPDITPEQWEKVYGDESPQMEERFQNETKPANDVPLYTRCLQCGSQWDGDHVVGYCSPDCEDRHLAAEKDGNN